MASYTPHAGRHSIASLVFFFLIGLALLLSVAINRTGLFDVDEAIFAQASVEMMETGNYVVPQYNGEPRYHKPPLIYWAQALVMDKFGVSPFAARLPSVLLSFLMVFGFYSFISGMTGNIRYALIASAVLAFNFSFFLISGAATADMALHCFSLLATMTLLVNIYAKQRGFVPMVIAGLLLSLAILAKGPVALMVPFIVIGLVWLVKEHRFYTLKCVNPVVIGCAVILGLIPWVHLIIQAKGPDFFVEFLWVHNIERFLGGMGNSHSGSPFYYLGVLLIGFFPWILILPAAVFWVMDDFIGRLRSDKLAHALPAIGLVWGVVVVVFFSFSATKLPHYILPALPGFALLIAARLDELPNDELGFFNWLWILPMILIMGGLFLAMRWVPDIIMGADSLPMWMSTKLQMWADQGAISWPTTDPQLISLLSQEVRLGITPVMMGAIIVIGGLVGAGFMMDGYRQGVFAWAGMMWLVLILAAVGILPTAYGYTQQALADFGTQIKEDYKEGDRAYFVAIHQPSVRFISGVPFVELDAPEQITDQKVPSGKMFFVLKEDRKQAVLKQLPSQTKIECVGGYCLAVSR